jgi:hypothetical protein
MEKLTSLIPFSSWVIIGENDPLTGGISTWIRKLTLITSHDDLLPSAGQSERFVVWYFEVDKKTVWKILSDCDATAAVMSPQV